MMLLGCLVKWMKYLRWSDSQTSYRSERVPVGAGLTSCRDALYGAYLDGDETYKPHDNALLYSSGFLRAARRNDLSLKRAVESPLKSI